jgi:hypothetical protein
MQNEQCSICHEPTLCTDTSLQCGHTFHASCIDRWILINPTCPMCRHKEYASTEFMSDDELRDLVAFLYCMGFISAVASAVAGWDSEM